MIHGCVTLDEVLAAAGARAASLVPETSGYLALALGDATARLPFAIEGRMVMLTTEGNVGITKRGEILPPRQAAQGIRAVLARLLEVATGTAMPGLSAAARPREESDRGVDAVIEEIEAALIPVNRAAARRALARLARETIKARESGQLKSPSTLPPRAPAAVAPPQPVAPPPVAPPPAVAPPPSVAPLPSIAPPVFATPAVEHVALETTTPPPEEPREPTPTLLGMAPVEALDLQTPVEVTTAEGSAVQSPELPRAPALEATALPESTVLAQPTEDPALAFSMSRRVDRPTEAFTPPFPFGVAPAPRILPAALEARAPLAPSSARCAPEPTTRADDLLARFGASCVDEESMREAAACLRRIAGVDLTKPPARVEIRPPPRVEIRTPPPRLASEAETPRTPRVQQRRGLTGAGVAFTLVVLAVGLAGGGVAVRLRPDLFGSPRHLGSTMGLPTAQPGPAPAAVEPAAGEPTPSYGERLGSARAERGSGPRAR